MANAVSHASLPYPVKNARYTIPVPYLDADGDPTDPTTPDTEVSKDGGSFADCAEEVTTISGSNGLGYLTLSGAETNCSLLSVVAKVASGPKATILIDKPRVLPIILSGTASAGGNTSITLVAGAYDLTGCIVRTTGGTGGGGTGGANNQARVITAYNTSTLVATVEPAWETNPDNTTTYDVLLTELACNTPVTRGLRPATDGRTLVVDAAGLADANTVKVGPSGSGAAQTARDIGASVLVGDKTGFSLANGTFVTATFGTCDLTSTMKASINTEADTALADAKAGYVAAIEAEIADDATGAAVKQAIVDKLIENLPNIDDLSLAAIASAVWANVSRTLTAGTNIVLAKGTGITGFNDLSSAQVNAEVDTAFADYDPPTNTEFEARTIAAANYATAANLAFVKADTAAILDDTGNEGVVVASGSKSGYALSSTGLNLVIPTDPGTTKPTFAGNSTIVQWIAFFGAWSVNPAESDDDSVTLKNTAGNANLASHATADDGNTFTTGAAS